MKQKAKVVIPTYGLFSKAMIFQDYKACPNCGQNEIPFKMGVCPRCGKRVGDVQYVRNPQEYVKSNYGRIKIGIREVYPGHDGR